MSQTIQPPLNAPDVAPPAGAHTGATLWGLSPVQLHDRYWAAHGVQVVRANAETELVPDAELYMLIPPSMLCLFRLTPLIDRLSWEQPELLWLRLRDERESDYAERAVHDQAGRFLHYRRHYPALETRLRRIVLTSDRSLAELWQRAPDAREGRARLRRASARHRRTMAIRDGRMFDNSLDSETMRFLRHLLRLWESPAATIHRIQPHNGEVWKDPSAEIAGRTSFVGPVWVGAGRRLVDVGSVVGPAVLWDEPDAQPDPHLVPWREIEPGHRLRQSIRQRQMSTTQRAGKRAFDLACALTILAFTLPFYPLIMLAIWLEDGRPFFFAHHRQGRGGTTFPCLKFRSMRKDAEKIKQELIAENQVDGPQFYLENDPRLTRVGRFLRATNIDELPQFINVLLGQMSVIGPRPSPDAEKQYCPPWREARLSVRPGITGLWQVRRSRDPNLDFQEWIRYDIEYVETMNWKLDLRIFLETFRVLFRGK